MDQNQGQNKKMLRIQKYNPTLWSFFDGEDRYKEDAIDDLNCQRWQDTLIVACVIATADPVPFQCASGEMSISDSTSYRDHHGDDGVDFTLHRATIIDKDRYLALRESHNELSENYKRSLVFSFTNIFYLSSRADLLEDDFLVLPPVNPSSYRHQIAVVARVKNVDGYYLFEFFEG